MAPAANAERSKFNCIWGKERRESERQEEVGWGRWRGCGKYGYIYMRGEKRRMGREDPETLPSWAMENSPCAVNVRRVRRHHVRCARRESVG